ncbi:hypothetical protein [Terrihabitans rhizophilus]|jgi:hypothetical protein|uniref:Uncharacterized protein n=1 Tax=Terrihabitans rhizophilus TaxID=3092662 RepID=A0ABU4RR54_9HYPH|nr:hypothetical protein [Terrihabitans sp. PJ23]MDX6806115.1 hypothetical protein [Terrihabitans sp. PJ23]
MSLKRSLYLFAGYLVALTLMALPFSLIEGGSTSSGLVAQAQAQD